jgi:hypothetical protein
MGAMIAGYREDTDNIEFKFIHVFARIETCEKWMDTWTALAKAKTMFNPVAMLTPTSNGRPIGNEKSKALRDGRRVADHRKAALVHQCVHG